MYIKRFSLLLLVFYCFSVTTVANDTLVTLNVNNAEKNLTFSATYWKLIHLDNDDINVSRLSREVHIVFSPLVKGKANFHGASGCNEILGKYEGNAKNITIDNTHIAMTKMACPDIKIETKFLQMLGAIVQWKIIGNRLKLLDYNQTMLAEFEAVVQ